MRSQNKNPKTTSRSSTTKKGSGQRANDIDSAILQKVSGKMGNESLQEQLKQRGGNRDQLLDFIVQHLQNIQSVQKIELGEMKNKEEWFRSVAKGENGFHLPQATRWHEAAKLFKRSAQAMCSGDLSRGKDLLDQALEQERAAYESLPKMVSDKLSKVARSGGEAPAELSKDGAEICPSTRLPQEIAIADQILNVRDVMGNAPPIRRTRPFTWWEDKEEESEEDEEDGEASEKKEVKESTLDQAEKEDSEKEQSDAEKEQ